MYKIPISAMLGHLQDGAGISYFGGNLMRNIAFCFFGAAVLCVTVGMFWGIHMAISGDHLMAPAHAHLNLVGWTTMGLFGLYYTVTPAAADTLLAKVHLGFAVL